MIGPRHMGSSPTLKRSLSRLSWSSSFQVRQSSPRIYTFLIAGGLLLLATVALLQVHLLRAPQGSKLSPLENGKPAEGIVPEQSWWGKNDRDLASGKERAVEKSKFGRKLGPGQVVKDVEEEESSDEDMDVGDEMEDNEDEDEEADQQALFDIDVDERMLEEEAEDLEDPEGILAEMSNDVDSVEDSAGNSRNEPVRKSEQKSEDNIISADSADKQGGEIFDSAKVILVNLVNDKKGSSVPANHDTEELGRHESKQDDKMLIPDWVLDIKPRRRQGGIVHTLQVLEKDLVKGLEEKKGSFFWDHTLGIWTRSLENFVPLSVEGTKDDVAAVKLGGKMDANHVSARDKDVAKVAMEHLSGFKEFVENWKERFNTDDELVDDNVQQRLEAVREIEDALLVNGDAALDKSTFSKFDALPKTGGPDSFDRLNPTSNSMLQDPDTAPGTWMTKTDKEMLRAMRGDRSNGGLQPKALLRGNILDVVTVADSVVRRQASTR